MEEIQEKSEVFHILIEGHISGKRAASFEGLEYTLLSDGTTLLSGKLVDQTALHSILLRIRDLNLKLISVNKV